MHSWYLLLLLFKWDSLPCPKEGGSPFFGEGMFGTGFLFVRIFVSFVVLLP